MTKSEQGLTPSQTVGPYLHIGLTWQDGHLVVPPHAPDAVRIVGTLYDGAGQPVPDGLIETWQADPDGHFDHPDDPDGHFDHPDDPSHGNGSPAPAGFTGFARATTLDGGRFEIVTVKPGPLQLSERDIEASMSTTTPSSPTANG